MAFPARADVTPAPAPAPVGSVRPRSRGRNALALVALTALVGAAALAAGTVIGGPTYTSEAAVLWDPSATAYLGLTPTDDPNAAERAVTDQKDVVMSDEVISSAGDATGLDPDVIRDAITVDVETGSSRLTISASADSADEAFRIADGVANAYQQNVRAAGVKALQDQAAVLQPSIDRLNQQLTDLQGQIARATDDLRGLSATSTAAGAIQAQLQSLGAQLGAVQTDLSQLQGKQEGLNAGAEVYPGQVVPIRAATEPTEPSSLSLPTAAAIGAALGLLLGVCVVVLLRRRAMTGRRIESV